MHKIPKYLIKDMRMPLTNEALKDNWNKFGKIYTTNHEILMIKNAITEFDKTLKIIDKNKNLNLLEIGCGSGCLAEYIIRNYSVNLKKARFVDISEYMINEAKKRLEALDIKNKPDIIVEVGNAENLKCVEETSYDIIFANLLIHLVTNPDNVFKTIDRCLSSNGVVFLSYTGTVRECSFFSKFNEILRKYDPEKPKTRQMFYFAEENIFEKLCKEHNYSIAEESITDILFNNGEIDTLNVYKDMLLHNKVDKKINNDDFNQLLKDIHNMINDCNRSGIDLNIKVINKHIIKK